MLEGSSGIKTYLQSRTPKARGLTHAAYRCHALAAQGPWDVENLYIRYKQMTLQRGETNEWIDFSISEKSVIGLLLSVRFFRQRPISSSKKCLCLISPLPLALAVVIACEET
jgi:hypothetical protein